MRNAAKLTPEATQAIEALAKAPGHHMFRVTRSSRSNRH